MVAVAALGVGVRSKLPQCGMCMARLSYCVAESSASPGASSTASLGKPPTSTERQQTSDERQQARLLHQLCEEWFGCGVSSQDFSTADTFVQHMLVRHHGWMPIANVVNPKCDPECTQPIRAPTAAPNALPSALLPKFAVESRAWDDALRWATPVLYERAGAVAERWTHTLRALARSAAVARAG